MVANDWQLGFHSRVKETRGRIKVIADQLQAFEQQLNEMQAIYEQTFKVSPASEAIPTWANQLDTPAVLDTPTPPAPQPPVSVEPKPATQVAPQPQPSPAPASAPPEPIQAAPPAQPAPPVPPQPAPQPATAPSPAPVPSPIPVTQPAPQPAPPPPPIVAEPPYVPITLPPIATPPVVSDPAPVLVPMPKPTVPAQAKPPSKLITFCGSPKVPQALIDKYEIELVTTLNEYAFDDQKGDGVFHGTGTANWASRIKLTPEDWQYGLQMDWENADNTPNPNMLSACAGFYNPIYYGDVQQKRIAEMVKAIEAVRVARPKAKIGVYNFPYFYYSAAADPAGHPWLTQQMTKANAILSRVDRYMPSMYAVYKVPEEKTKKQVQDAWRNAANICLMGDKPVFPFINYVWYANGTGHEKGTRLPLDHVYMMVEAWNQGHVDNKEIAGVTIWNSVSSGDNPLDEPTLKVIRAALDRQPFPG